MVSGSSIQYNSQGKEMKDIDIKWEDVKPSCRWHESICWKSYGIYKKAVRTHTWQGYKVNAQNPVVVLCTPHKTIGNRKFKNTMYNNIKI